MLDVGRLRVLLAISEHGELPAAARALGTPVADAAAQLSALERELRMTLAEGDRLTPAGRRLAGHAGRLVGQLEAAESEVAAVAGRACGVLRLGIGAAAGRALLPDALATLRTTAPELELSVQQLADERVTALGAERLDVAVVGEFAAAVPRRVDADTERRELLTEPLLVAVPARHPASGTSVRLGDLSGERWVGGPVGSDALTALERVAAGAGFEPRLVGHAGEDGLALALVAAGAGVALVPASSVPVPMDGVRFLTAVDPGLRRTVSAVVRRSAAGDPAVLRLLDALGQAARRVAAAVSGVTAAPVPAPPAAPVPLVPTPPIPPAPVPPPVAPGREPYLPPGGYRSPGEPARRPDPLFDPLPGTGRAGPADLPGPRRDPVPEPLANGHAGSNGLGGGYGLESYRSEPARNGRPAEPPGPRREPPVEQDPRRRRSSGPLPPPGFPVDRPRAAGPPDLGVRPPGAGDLAGGTGPGTGSYAERAGIREGPDDAGDTLPPAPPGAEDVRLSIFEDLQSEWFVRHDDGTPPASWHTPADEGWKAAARLAEPATAGTTTAGLPRRRPQALYVPGAVGDPESAPNGAPTRSPQEMRGRLSSYREGVRRGRHAEPREE